MVDLGTLGPLDVVDTPFASGALQARDLTRLNERDGTLKVLAID
jgi:hypothetical protein